MADIGCRLGDQTIRPYLIPFPLDFLALVRASISDASTVSVEHDLGIDFDEDDRLTGPLVEDSVHVSGQSLRNSKRAAKRKRQAANRKAQSPTTSTSLLPPLSPTASPLLPTATPPTPKLHRQSHANAKRAEKRKCETDRPGPSKHTLTEVLAHRASIEVALEATDFAAAKGAHMGKRGTAQEIGTISDRRRKYYLSDLLSLGFRHIQWDGRMPIPIIDPIGRIVAVLAGQPTSAGYDMELMQAFEAFMAEGDSNGLTTTALNGDHPRGSFPAFNRGYTMGMGSPNPVVLKSGNMTDTLNRLVGHSAVKRMAYYHNAAFELWAPRVYAEYQNMHQKLHQHLPHLPENFKGGVFAAAAFNFGRNVWTFKHRDFLNWPFGWCAITALGRFDPTRSAQLILWEFKLVIDFPHGATVLIPSAVVTHSNTPIAEGDVRTSFTQYTAGALFRWTENGFMTEEQLQMHDPGRYDEMVQGKEEAYLQRVDLFSSLEELVNKSKS